MGLQHPHATNHNNPFNEKEHTMAVANLHVSSAFFKEISLEYQQLSYSVQLLGTFTNRAWVRSVELDDKRLMLICDQLDIFVSVTKRHMENLEKLLRSTVVVD
jgi:hypothetical protein